MPFSSDISDMDDESKESAVIYGQDVASIANNNDESVDFGVEANILDGKWTAKSIDQNFMKGNFRLQAMG